MRWQAKLQAFLEVGGERRARSQSLKVCVQAEGARPRSNNKYNSMIKKQLHLYPSLRVGAPNLHVAEDISSPKPGNSLLPDRLLRNSISHAKAVAAADKPVS